jgi:polysaccharide biosynthesis protein PslH
MEAAPRFLLLTRSLPWPTSIGTCQRTALIHRTLRSLGPVDMLMVSRFDEVNAENRDMLSRDFGLIGVVKPPYRLRRPWWRAQRTLALRVGFGVSWTQPELHWSREISDAVRTALRARRYALVFSRYLQPLAQAGRSWAQPTLLDIDDFPSEVARSGESLRSGEAEPPYVPFMREIEQRTCARCEHVFVAKPTDRAGVGHERVSLLPNVPFVPEGKTPPEALPPADASRTILMVSSFAHDVNVRAVEAFLERMWPRIRAAAPDARFRIVGNGTTPELAARWASAPGVDVAGFVPDLAEAYGACAFSIAPIWEGGGTKIKVLESLLYARTGVIASYSQRGYEETLRHGESLLVAADADEFTAACIELLRRPELRNRLASEGRAVVRASYSTERFQAIVLDAVHTALREGAGIESRGARP